eukprot:TRINITY_DN2061_c0_g1_i14.p1 TRINITY_DN2061_c0_g1~~TRINITY_DN2061_c0_g1_i14.p1  ORF type:complete len:140 (+),score=23.18 TRINITY_DN2061_c0_g1_i14:289-708(+)
MAHTENTGSGFVLRGNALYHKKEFQGALESYKKALEKESLSRAKWNIHNRLAATYSRLGDHASALAEAQSMIDADPEHPKGHVRKGGAHFFLKQYDHALVEYSKASHLMEDALQSGLVEQKLADDLAKYMTETKLHLGE